MAVGDVSPESFASCPRSTIQVDTYYGVRAHSSNKTMPATAVVQRQALWPESIDRHVGSISQAEPVDMTLF